MTRQKITKESNGDIYCSLRVDTIKAYKQLRAELHRQQFQHSQTLIMAPIDEQVLRQLGQTLALEFLLVIIHNRRLYQYAIHPISEELPTTYRFSDQHKIYVHPDYLELYLQPDSLPPYSSFQIMA